MPAPVYAAVMPYLIDCTNFTATALFLCALTACGDDGASAATGSATETSTGTSAGTSTSGDETTSDIVTTTTGAAEERALVVPEGFELCSQTLRPALELGELFRSKARVKLGAGRYDISGALPPTDGTPMPGAPFVIPVEITHQLELAPPQTYAITLTEATMDRALDVVLTPMWGQDPLAGFQTVRVFQRFSVEDPAPTAWEPFGSTHLAIAVSDGSDQDELDLAEATSTAFSLRTGFGGALAPCDGPGLGLRTDTFTLDAGTIAFTVRKEPLAGGTMLHAVGAVDGVVIDESEFWNLEYGVSSAEGTFDASPFYAVRFPETAQGECGLWVGMLTQEDRAAAFFLDCAMQITRELAILSAEAGELMPAA